MEYEKLEDVVDASMLKDTRETFLLNRFPVSRTPIPKGLKGKTSQIGLQTNSLLASDNLETSLRSARIVVDRP